MDFRNVLGGLLQQGMTRSTHGRMDRASGGLLDMLGGGRASSGGGGLGGVLGGMLGGGGTGRSAGPGQSGGGLGGMLGGMLGGQGGGGIPNVSKTQAGGIGAVLGSVLMGRQGRGVGALKGGAIGVIAAMALQALRERQATAAAQQPAQIQNEQDLREAFKRRLNTDDAELERLTSPETARLVLRGMLEAAKADGQIDPEEMKRILGKLNEDGEVDDEERRFVLDQMGKPADLDGLVRDIPTKEIAAEVYAAALLAIEVDTAAERQFLSDLARRTGLDDGTAQRLHQLIGASS